jgi:site-specific DNA-cytosine methylase
MLAGDTLTITVEGKVGWTEGFSNHRRFAMLGNAVTVAVVEEIAKRL